MLCWVCNSHPTLRAGTGGEVQRRTSWALVPSGGREPGNWEGNRTRSVMEKRLGQTVAVAVSIRAKCLEPCFTVFLLIHLIYNYPYFTDDQIEAPADSFAWVV